ncbi:MAG: hypothetical protein IPG45_01825 [Deltaproteobacteria bacterium]|nr:hypothetical protein [Deltaproteobacteria bacterium]
MNDKLVTVEDFFLLLGSLLESRRAAFRRRLTLAFAVVDGGPWFVDTGAPRIIVQEWRRDAQVSVLCNRRTLSDLVGGHFDPNAPAAEHLFVWGGDKETFSTLAQVLGGAMTAFGAHLSALKR